MTVHNVHRRHITDVSRVGTLLDALASPQDALWPADRWPTLHLDRPLQIGARGGHGPIRYSVELYEPGRRVRFRFERPRGLDGFHEFHIVDGDRPELVHRLEARLSGVALLSWPLVFRPLHDDLIEDALTNAAPPAVDVRASRLWSLRTRVLRRLLTRGRRRRHSRRRHP